MPGLLTVRSPHVWFASAAAAVGIAYAGAAWPLIFGLVVGCFVLAVTAGVGYRWPRHLLLAAPTLVFLAGTKFRVRDARASLAMEVDAQILFETGMYAALGVGLLAVVVSRFVRLNRPAPLELLLLAFVTVVLASLIWTAAPALAAVRAMQMSVLLFWAMLASRAMTNREMLLSVGIAVSALVLAFAAIAVVIPPTNDHHSADFTRFYWFAVHPIHCASLAAIALLFVASYALLNEGNRGPLRLMVALACCTTLLIVVIATRSRGPLVALAAALGALVALRLLRGWRAPLAIASAAVAALYYTNVGLSPADLLSLISATDNEFIAFLVRNQSIEQLTSLTGRADLWSMAIDLIRERPLFGHGYQSSRGLLLDDFPWAAYAHNAFLQVLLEVGLVGGALLILSVLLGLATTLRNRWQRVLTWERGVLGALLVFLVINASTSESFAAAPGIELMLLFVCVLLSAPVTAAEASRRRSMATPPGRRPPIPSRQEAPAMPTAYCWSWASDEPTRQLP